jgi:hypothetical protein
MSCTTDARDAGKPPGKRPVLPLLEGQDQDTLIAELTLRKWEMAGKPRGQWEVFWIEAELELTTDTRW